MVRRPLLFCWLCFAFACHAASPFAGRWDFIVTSGPESYPGWMEVVEDHGNARIRVQPRTGSVVPAGNVRMEGTHLAFSFGREIHWDLDAAAGELSGTQKMGNRAATLKGVRAPDLRRPAPKSWSAPEPLFDGSNLKGWQPDRPEANHWVARDGVLLNEERGSNLRTTRAFDDFKLHIELNCPDGGNSGVYLRGRYEIQVAYEKGPDAYHSMGSIYGFLKPSVEMPRRPGQWETLEATLIGRRVTLVRDGVTILDDQEIPGITGGALDSNEAAPGPIYIQGDHTGGMKYRNIRISLPN
ncbi:MAG TPA: DUF1080 domain-containing protein [Bryobacteraceae bacterium]|jgi:hypothetical protein|nr:DUF1080 domain-containing protein [Bryobacteraceae bacterium]